MKDLAEYLDLHVKFREHHKLNPVTDEEKQEWSDEWNKLKKKDRARRLDDIRTHVIISGVARRACA